MSHVANFTIKCKETRFAYIAVAHHNKTVFETIELDPATQTASFQVRIPDKHVVHVKITTWKVVDNPDSANHQVVLPAGGCVVALGVPPKLNYMPAHVPYTGTLPTLFQPPREVNVIEEESNTFFANTYRLENSQSGWVNAKVVSGESSGHIYCTLPPPAKMWCVTKEYAEMASGIIERGVQYLEENNLPSRIKHHFGLLSFVGNRTAHTQDQRGFDRTAQYRLEWPFCAMPGTLSVSEANAVSIDQYSLAAIVQLACVLCDFDCKKLLKKTYSWSHTGAMISHEPTENNQCAWRAVEAIAILSVSVAGAYGGWYNEKYDDMTAPYASLLTQIDCEDQAVQSCNFFNNMHRHGSRISRPSDLFELVCMFLYHHYDSMFLACGYVDQHIAMPGVEADESNPWTGHGFGFMRRREPLRGKFNKDTRQCGGPYGVLVECTTAMLPHHGYRFGDLPASQQPELATINTKLAASCAKVYNSIIGIGIAEWNLTLEEGSFLERAVFAATSKYKTCAFVTNATGSFIVIQREAPADSHKRLVGVSIQDFLDGTMQLVPAHSSATVIVDDVDLGYTDQTLCDAVFAPLNWKELPLDVLPTQSASEWLYGTDVSKSVEHSKCIPRYRRGAAVRAPVANDAIAQAARDGEKVEFITDSARASCLHLPCMSFFIVGEELYEEHRTTLLYNVFTIDAPKKDSGHLSSRSKARVI